MLKAALSGNYVSFGVFRLYGDDALDNSLNTFVKLLLSIPQSDLLVSKFLIFRINFCINTSCLQYNSKYHNLTAVFCVNSFQDYPKLSQSYYALLECLAQDHMTFISNIEPQVLLYVLSTISEGLTALGKKCLFVVYCLCSWIFPKQWWSDGLISYLKRKLLVHITGTTTQVIN